MTRSLDDLDRARPVDPEKVAAAEERLLARQRAWQLRELRTQQELTQAELTRRDARLGAGGGASIPPA